MEVEDATAQLRRVDDALRSSIAVDPRDLKISIGELYNDRSWGGPSPTPLPLQALTALSLMEATSDSRWAKHFTNNSRHLGVYRTRWGTHWVLVYDGVARDHLLQYVGTADDVQAKFR